MNISRLQSDACDLTERAAFSIGSVKVRKYLNYSVQFRFSLCDFEKTVRVRLRFETNSVKPVYNSTVRVRFDLLQHSVEIFKNFQGSMPLEPFLFLKLLTINYAEKK